MPSKPGNTVIGASNLLPCGHQRCAPRASTLPGRSWVINKLHRRAGFYTPIGTASRAYPFAKRSLDVIVCLLLLPPVSLVIAICGAAVWLESPGPVFFRQMRTGLHGKRFPMLKLRTMVRNAEELKAVYAHLNELTPPDFKISNDPRVTRFGRFLRRTSLDELPQLVNVLRGQMSLVGPRPTSFSADTYRLWHTERLEVIPGITGLWQVRGRSDLDFDDRLCLDIQYVRSRSLLLDLRLLLETVTAVATSKGAY